MPVIRKKGHTSVINIEKWFNSFEFDKGSATTIVTKLHKKERLNNLLMEGQLR